MVARVLQQLLKPSLLGSTVEPLDLRPGHLLHYPGNLSDVRAALARVSAKAAHLSASAPYLLALRAARRLFFLLGSLLAILVIRAFWQGMNAAMKKALPFRLETQPIARVVLNQAELLAVMFTRTTPDHLHELGKRLAQRLGQDHMLHVRLVKAARQNIGADDALQGGIRAGEFFQDGLLVVFVVFVGDADEVVAGLLETAGKLLAVLNAR